MSAAVERAQLELRDLPPANESAVAALAALPYRRAPYARRNWGHPFHSLCSYPSKMKPGIAHFLVRLFTRPGDTVLDPFCGVGTIPFEACNQGRLGVGSDLNPLAATVTRAKVDPPSPAAAGAIVEQLARAVADAPHAPEVDPEIASFFHEETLREIVAARAVLLLLELLDADGERASAAAFVRACLAHVLHGNRPYALSRRSHNVIPIPPKGEFAYKPVVPALRTKIDRSLAVPLDPAFRRGRAARLPYEEVERLGPADHVISSPPFLGTTHFVRQNRVRLWLCGWDYRAQEAAKPEFLEHQPGLEPYRPIFARLRPVLREGGTCVLHLGVVKRVDMAAAVAPYAAEAGFAVEGIVYEDAGHLESHGRTDRGGTHRHQFLVLTKR